MHKHSKILFSKRLFAGPRKYFFDIRTNKNGEAFLMIIETKRHGAQARDRHQIHIYKEDLLRFKQMFNETADKMKEMYPDYKFYGLSNYRRDGAPPPEAPPDEAPGDDEPSDHPLGWD